MRDKDIEKALDLINKDCFKKALKHLLNLRRKTPTPYINYLLGCIHHVNIPVSSFSNGKDKFNGSKKEAKRFLGNAIDAEKPIEDAFWRLADIEDNRKHAVRILKKGLKHFPNSEIIYGYLISKSEDSEIPKIYKEIENKKIVSNAIYFKLYNSFSRQKKYTQALSLIKKIRLKKQDEKQLINLIKAFCLYELSEITKAETIFRKLIDDDVNLNLNYAQYIGLLLCSLEKKEASKITNIVKELPYKFVEPFVYIHSNLHFIFENYEIDLINKLTTLFKSENEYKEHYAKIRGIKALKACELDKINKQTIFDLKFARNNLKDNEIFNTELVSAYISTNQLLKAFERDFKNAIEYSNYEPQAEWIFYDISKKDLKKIVDSFLIKLSNTSSWQRKKIKRIMEDVVLILHKNKDYEKVVKVSTYFSEDILGKTNILFELGFAYSKIGNKDRAKRFYEQEWSENKTSAVANNLALLYENEENWLRAKELFERAVKLDQDDDIACNNLKRINKRIEDDVKDLQKWEKEQKEALESVKNENTYIHEKLAYLISAEDERKYIVASHRQLSEILKINPDKVRELIKSFLQKNYVTKVKNHNIDTYSNVYRMNYLVRKFIAKRKKRIRQNKALTIIGDKINIDSFEGLGFNVSLLSNIDSKVSDQELKKILRRDLKEIVFALITKSYKTALVLSGSVIESFILNKIFDSNITKHLPNARAKKNKKVLNMNLSELLYVADQNQIIDNQLYHFSQVLKEYRNLIHPAVEIRKGKIKKITERDAKLAWEIAKKVISEI